MEEMSPAVAVTLSLSNPICDNPGIASQVEISRLTLVTETASFLSDRVLPEGETGGKSNLLETITKSESGWIASDAIIQENEDYGIFTIVEDPNGIISETLLPMDDDNSEISLPIAVEIGENEKGQIIGKIISLGESSIEQKSTIDLLTVAASPNEIEKGKIGRCSRRVFDLEYIPLWGSVSICGKRAEMEDAVVSVPWFIKIPIELFCDHGIKGISQSLSHLTAHFFGVYDGHGGSQVANYCRDRIHLALGEELKDIGTNLAEVCTRDAQLVQWQKAFTRCFLKVDDEVGGKVNRNVPNDISFDPVAPETVGSTAVVALICSSHIIVANCGDSRAVLYHGKEPMALSVDHKPNREDEYERIEESGGKVIQWNGHRVFGVLAMSRSIGRCSSILISWPLHGRDQ